MTSYRIALACALIPFSLGVSLFFLWLVTDWDTLMILGGFVIIGGFVLFFIGLFALFWFKRQAQKMDIPYKKRISLAVSLLVLNFPVAAAIIACVCYLVFGYFITVDNQSRETVHITLLDPDGSHYEMADIPPQRSITEKHNFAGEGSVDFELTMNGKKQSGMLLDYVTNGTGGSAILTVSPEGSVSAKEKAVR